MREPVALLWVDMEMTGLDAEHDVIIEAAGIVTALDEYSERGVYHAVIHQSDLFIEQADAVVKKMHTASGLWDRVRASSTTVREAEAGLLDLARQHGPAQGLCLAGNSIHHDRNFIEHYMPTLHAYLHYRMVDVSSLKILAKAWYGPSIAFPKAERHTALEDIRESVAELQHYQRAFDTGPRDISAG